MAAKKSAKKTEKKSSGKKSKFKVDFTGVETGGGRVPEGQYLARPIEATREDGNAGEYIAWVYQVTEGKQKGKKLYDNTSLTAQSLWRLRLALEAMGQEGLDGPADLDLDALCEDEDNIVCIDVADDIYQGKKKSKIVGVYGKDDYNAEEEEEGEEAEAPDFDEMDEEELAAFAEEHELDVKLKGSVKKQRKAVAEAFAAGAEAEEEEEEKPAKKGKKKDEDDKPSEDDVMEMSADELAELVDEHDLDVDLEEIESLKKMRKAVVEALEGDGEKDEEGKENEKYTADQIDEMSTKELEEVVEKHELEVELEGSTKTKRRKVKKALEENDLMEEDEE